MTDAEFCTALELLGDDLSAVIDELKNRGLMTAEVDEANLVLVTHLVETWGPLNVRLYDADGNLRTRHG